MELENVASQLEALGRPTPLHLCRTLVPAGGSAGGGLSVPVPGPYRLRRAA